MLFAESFVKELHLVLRRRSERRALKPVFVRAWGDQGDRTNAVDNKKDNKELISLTLGVALLREQCNEKLFWGKHHGYSWYPTSGGCALEVLTPHRCVSNTDLGHLDLTDWQRNW